MLVLLSSGARHRYREDIVRCLALPNGLDLQFRYEVKIVENEVLEAAEKGALLGETALVCYLSNRVEGGPINFVACRVVKIAKAEVVGTSLIILLVAQGFANVPDSDSFERDLSSVLGNRLPHWEKSGASYSLSGYFVLQAKDDLPIESTPNITAFESNVKRLCLYSDFSKEKFRNFFTIVSLSRVDASWQGTEVFSPRTPSNFRNYLLESGKEYEVKLYVYAPEEGVSSSLVEFSINIDADSKNVVFPLEKMHAIDFEYDLKRFRFSLESQSLRMPTTLHVFVSSFSDKDRKCCDVSIPVIFEGDWFRSASRAVPLAVAASGPAMISAYAADKLSPFYAALMILIAFIGSLGSVFFPSKK